MEEEKRYSIFLTDNETKECKIVKIETDKEKAIAIAKDVEDIIPKKRRSKIKVFVRDEYGTEIEYKNTNCRMVTDNKRRVKMKLLDALNLLSINNYLKYLIPISEALEDKAGTLDERIMSMDNPSDDLVASFDELTELIDTIDEKYIDAEKSKTSEKMNELIEYMKKEIVDYQKYYGGLKNIEI